MTSRFDKPGYRDANAHADQPHRDDGKRDIRGNIHVRGEIETQIPPSLLEEYRTSSEKDERREDKRDAVDKWRFRIEVITLILVAIYASLTYWQAQSSARQLKFVEEADRPWIGVDMAFSPLEAGKDESISVTFTNAGHRPGKVVSMNLRMDALKRFSDRPNFQIKETSTGTFFPGNSFRNVFTRKGPDVLIMEAIQSHKVTMFGYIDVEYIDVETQESHITRACWKYIPEANTFFNCTQEQDYNTAN